MQNLSYGLLWTCLSACFSFLPAHCTKSPDCARTKPDEPFLPAIWCASDFNYLQGAPLSSQYAQVDAVKLVYDIQTRTLYFINNRQFGFHYDFCTRYLAYSGDLSTYNAVEYGHAGTRRYLLANLNYYRASDVYTLEFFSDDEITPGQIADLYRLVADRVYFRGKLRLLSDPERQPPGLGADRFISIDRLFAMQQYQPMTPGKAYGYLQKVGKDAYEKRNFAVHDIILTDFLPNDLPFCQGILTTAFQTPLAHINVLSYNRKTPNCAYKDAWNAPQLQQLVGKLVCYEVLPDTFLVREVSLEEAQFAWELKRRGPGRTLARNLLVRELQDIRKIDRNSAAFAGAKAANLAETAKIRLPDQSAIPIPEGAFAIPFFYYHQHIMRNRLQPMIDRIVRSDSICNNRTLLDRHLKALRDSIKACPLDPKLLHKVVLKLRAAKGYTDFRFRSSTNAEDIPGFTGAGLYASKTGSLHRSDKPVDEAIKKVWASLWTLRAFEERLNANIDQSNLAMAILVHRAFGTEAANGVAITRNLYRSAYPAFTINVQKGEDSVVLPENQATPEQLLVKYGRQSAGGLLINVEYISHSSLNDFKALLTREEIQVLAEYLYAIKTHFYYARGGVVLGPEFYNFALDVEFKLDRQTRKVYIKQVRPY